MTRRHILCVLAAGVAVSATLAAQSKPAPSAAPSPGARPDFSGTWTHVSSESSTGGGGRGGFNLGLEFSVTQDDKSMTVVGNPARGGPVKSVYNLDGSTTQSDNGRNVSKITWQGSKLVIATGPNPPRTQVWS